MAATAAATSAARRRRAAGSRERRTGPKLRRTAAAGDERLGAIKLDRLVFSSLSYPTDYSFFERTLVADGDPLDAMVAVSEPTFPGCLIEARKRYADRGAG